MTGIILAGGRGRRISAEKPLIEIGGKKVISRIIDIFSGLFEEIIVVTNSPEKYEGLGVIIAGDVILGKGPMVGIYSGLLVSSHQYNFVVGGDMPFIKAEFVEYIMSIERDGFDVIVPEKNGYYEPLHAIYSKSCMHNMRKLIKEGKLKIQDLYKILKLKTVIEEITIKFDPHFTSFFNINTKEDLMRAEKIATNFP